MAAKPPHALLIDCPPSRHDGGGDGDGWRQQRRAWRNNYACRIACRVAALVLFVAAVITGFVLLEIFIHRKFPTKDPVYTVAIAGVSGLDVLLPPPPPPSSPSPAAADDTDDGYYYNSPATLSPVFDLTFQIDNTQNSDYDPCIPGLSRAEVSYGDAFLAGGSVPPFCAGKMRMSGPVAARAWGQDVAVPRFLRDQLAAELAAGDASVDVKVTMPHGNVLSCKPKIGDGKFAVCRLDDL